MFKNWFKKLFKCKHKDALDFPKLGCFICFNCKTIVIYDKSKYSKYKLRHSCLQKENNEE